MVQREGTPVLGRRTSGQRASGHPDPAGRQPRHGRPKPLGGQFRLPAFRVSGAAMAMSTVVGLSIATTLLISEQQRIGAGIRMSTVGATPPPPQETPSAPTDAFGPVAGAPAAGPARPAAPGPYVPASRAPGAGASPQHPAGAAPTPGPDLGAATPAAPAAPAPPPAPTGAGYRPVVIGPTGPAMAPTGPAKAPTVPARTPTATPSGTPASPAKPPVLTPLLTPGTEADGDNQWWQPDTGRPPVDQLLADPLLAGLGSAVAPSGAGLQRTLTLTVAEPLAAVEAELRLDRADAAGAMAWSTLPGARVTLHQDGAAVVYRFAPAPGEDVRPGVYTFTVQDARSAVPALAGPGAGDGWTASGFALRHPRAVAAHGAFVPSRQHN